MENTRTHKTLSHGGRLVIEGEGDRAGARRGGHPGHTGRRVMNMNVSSSFKQEGSHYPKLCQRKEERAGVEW